jgi:hypothetical protein
MSYLDELKNAKPTVTITPTPLIMEKVGEMFRGLYVGMQTFDKTNTQTGETNPMPVVHFYDGEGIRFNMGAQLTRAMSMLKPGISVEIKLVELKPNSKGGRTKIYSVTPLNIKRVNLDEMFGGVLSIEAPAPEHLITSPAPVIESGDGEEVDELTAAGIPRKTEPEAPRKVYRIASVKFNGLTPAAWHEMCQTFSDEHPNWQIGNTRNPDMNHILASAGHAGYEYITGENVQHMFVDIVKEHEAKA